MEQQTFVDCNDIVPTVGKRLSNRQTETHTVGQPGICTYRQIDRETDKQLDD